MKLIKRETVINMDIELNGSEIEHLMHIVWFALDYDEKTQKMTESEREIANKLLKELKGVCLDDRKEIDI